jgi:asparagine synthase (glutamine-hydrolysing)
MCGITGYINLNRGRNIDPAVLKSMTDVIHHRGPDDEGFYIDQNVGLGFRRLSIIDLHTGHQPLSNNDESITIVFNGEIYNYQEQREMLKKKGYTFKSVTDTEVILYLYEEHGIDCVKYLRGMFGFAIWDKKKQQLFCARDRFGIKPFFYYHDNEKFVFGSEIKSILKAENIDKTLDVDALDSYFAYGYITGDLSVYKNIRKLQPSHSLLISLGDKPKISINRYWEINFEPDYSKTESQWIEEIQGCLAETIKLHMIADVPLGAFLSGGIDSSSVVSIMAKHSAQPIKTFSIGFKEQKFNELQYAKEVARKYNCEYHEQIVEPESISLLPRLAAAFDEPFADSSAIPTYYVSKFAREYVTVVLSGDGGDELFAGYNSYAYFKKIYKYASPSAFVNGLLWGSVNALTPKGSSINNTSYYLSHKRDYSGAQATFWTIDERKKLLGTNPGYKNVNRAELIKEKLLNGSKHDLVTNLQGQDMQTYMVDDILTKVDRTSMMSSIEARVPLLDHKFAELSFRIPWNFKLKEGSQKYILKKAVMPYLPDSIINHPKQGFAVPFSIWFKDDLKEYINDTLGAPNTLYSSWLDKGYVSRLIHQNNNSSQNLSSRIWSLLFFEAWLKQNQ